MSPWRLACAAYSHNGLLSTTRTATRLYSQNVGILGGGLAGLSTAFHLIHKTNGSCHVTIYDKAPVGQGGASSVAGGMLHPLSPKGKLVHWGLEGLAATNYLIDYAVKYKPECVLRNELYRVATTNKNVQDLTRTATELPDLAEWMDSPLECGVDLLGGVRLHKGCKVLHVPTYLEGLLLACREFGTVEWKISPCLPTLHDHNVIVYAAGAGLWKDSLLPNSDKMTYPIQLVKGQSMDLIVDHSPKHAILAGKYVTPHVEPHLCHVGATQEYKDNVLSPEELYEELRSKTSFLSLWSCDPKIHRITCGIRVQTTRTNLGRLPMIGRIDGNKNNYIFSGLSSRGLLYHGIYGDLLTDAILGRQNLPMEPEHFLNWWR